MTQSVKDRLSDILKAEPTAKAEVKAEVKSPETKPIVKVRTTGGRRWWLAGVGLAILAIAFYGISSFGESRNTLVGFISVMVLGGGAVCVYYGLKKSSEGMQFVRMGSKKGKTELVIANSLNIYPDHVEFENVQDDKCLGQPRKCRNDGKHYYVHIWNAACGELPCDDVDKNTSHLTKFILPDTQYRDPREFANNLNIPAHRRLAQRRAGLMEKIAPWIIVAAIAIVPIVMTVALGKSGGG